MSRGYKLPENTAERSGILVGLRALIALDLGGFEVHLAATSDCLDALVSSIVARAYQLRRTDPIPDEDRDKAVAEGWIHLPTAEGLSDGAVGPLP